MRTRNSNNIVVSRVTKQNANAAFTLACEVFVDSSVLHAAVGISNEEYRDYMRLPFKWMWEQGLSLIATDANNKELVGCIISCDYAALPHNSAPLPEKLKPVNALLHELDELYREKHKILPGNCLLVDMAVVKPTSRGQGIYSLLRQQTHNIGRELGFEKVIGELSSAATQRLCVDRLGHTVCAEIEYASFSYENEKPFSSIKDPTSIKLVESSLRNIVR